MPLVPGWWLGFTTSYLNRFFVFAQLGPAQNAILAVCIKIASVIGLFSVSFATAWQPLAMSHIGDKSGEVFYVRSMRLFIAGGIFSIFCLSALIEPILTYLTPNSYGVIKYYFPMFAVIALLRACTTNLQLGNQIAKTTHWVSISAFIAFTINLIILIFLTKSYGIFACGLAWIVSFTAQDVLLYATAQKNHHIPYDNKAFLFLVFGCVFLLMLGYLNYSQHIASWIFTSCVAFIGIILPWFVMAPFERQAMKQFAIAKTINS